MSGVNETYKSRVTQDYGFRFNESWLTESSITRTTLFTFEYLLGFTQLCEIVVGDKSFFFEFL